MDDLALCQMFRPTCTDCGSRDLRWMTASDLLSVRPLSVARVREAMDVVGANGPAWSCPRCSGWGLFG